MRKLALFIGYLCVHAPSLVNAQNKPNFEINGHIGGLKEQELVYIGLTVEGFVPVREDSDYIKNGDFHLKGHVSEGPRQYQIRIPESGKIIRLFLDSGDHVVINCPDIKKTPKHGYIDHNITIEGSRPDYSMNSQVPAMLLFAQNIAILNGHLRRLKDSMGFDPTIVGGIIDLKTQLKSNLYAILFNTDDLQYLPALPAIATFLYPDLEHSPVTEIIYSHLDDRRKNSFYGKRLKEKLPLNIGKPFPLFTLNTLDDKPLNLKEVISNSKVTLVNFWSVKSVQVGKENMDELWTMYQKYHSKGLNIVNVSSDTVDYEWKGYVKKQKFPWYDVSDLKGEDGVVGTVYHEYGTPGTSTPNITHVLIDKDGKIIAWDPIGLELQYYLWKYLEQ